MEEEQNPPQRKEGKSMYASREHPLHESIFAPTDTGIRTGKLRPVPTDND